MLVPPTNSYHFCINERFTYESEDRDWGTTMQGKQATMVSPLLERAILGYLATTHSPARDQVMCLLSMKAGLRATAMVSLTWTMVTDAAG